MSRLARSARAGRALRARRGRATPAQAKQLENYAKLRRVHELRAQQAAGKARTVEVGKKGGANVYRRGDGSYVLGSSKPNGPNGGRSFQTISKAEGKRIEFGKSSRKHRAGDALRAGAIGGGIYGMERYKKKHEGN